MSSINSDWKEAEKNKRKKEKQEKEKAGRARRDESNNIRKGVKSGKGK